MKNQRCSKRAFSRRSKTGCHGLEPHTRSPQQQGFSLIELVMAAVLLASAGAMLVGGLVAANRSSDARIEQALSTQVLASQFALLDEQITPQTPTRGTVSSPLGEYTWTLEWTKAPLAPLVEATLTLSRKDRASHVVTYRPLIQP